MPKHKLDPFAERLVEWRTEGKTLQQMQEQLKLDGCVVSLSLISQYISKLHQQELEEKLFATIATGGRMNKELSEAFQKDPAPEIGRLIEMTKTLVLSLQVHGVANPKLLSLANNMQRTVLDYLSGRTKAELDRQKLELEERRVKVLEEKAAKADQAKGVLEDKALTEEQRVARMREVFGMS
jgi:hypothetical protein